MSSPNPQQSSLERTRAEPSSLDQPFKTNVEKFHAAFGKFETQLDSLKTSFKDWQQSAIINVNNALKVSDTRSHELEQGLREEKQRVSALTSELSTQKQEAKTKHHELTLELAAQRIEHGMAEVNLQKAESKLEEANRQAARLRKDLEAAKTSTTLAQKHLADTAELCLERINAVRQRETDLKQQNIDLQADLEATRQRASAAEGLLKLAEEEMNAFKTRFDQINDTITASSPSSTHRQPQSALSPSLLLASQDSVERNNKSQRQDHTLQTSSSDSHTSTTTSDNGPDSLHCQNVLDEVMDMKDWEENRHFLTFLGLSALASLDASIGPMNLDTVKQKLAGGALKLTIWASVDLNTMIANCRRLDSPQNHVHNLAESLSKIFKQSFSTQPNSSHQYLDLADSIQGAGKGKRKAEADPEAFSEGEHNQKRRSLGPFEQDTSCFQPSIPDTRGSLIPVLPPCIQSEDSSHSAGRTDAYHTRGQPAIVLQLDTFSDVRTVAQLVSFTKSPSLITGHWESLLPKYQRLTTRAGPERVGDRIVDPVRNPARDLIIVSLVPTAGTDKAAFNNALEFLIATERVATAHDVGIDNVQDVCLVPASKADRYLKYFSTLDLDLLPKTEDVFLMAIIFAVAEDRQRQFRQVWDGRLKAIKNCENGGLTSMRDMLVRNPLELYIAQEYKAIVSSANRHISVLSSLPYSKEIASPELRAYGQNILRLSYASWVPPPSLSINGVRAPVLVFVLGRAFRLKDIFGHLVIDIQNPDRPLWLICRMKSEQHSGRDWSILLLWSKFPASLNEWNALNEPGMKYLKNVGLKLERCKVPD